ncbi:hypothetical protein BD408DRAFT_157637 [Parasitella parasitica]|nr:hypothetical protein BD408DRAFT_157637 [Parasitella parasitica]
MDTTMKRSYFIVNSFVIFILKCINKIKDTYECFLPLHSTTSASKFRSLLANFLSLSILPYFFSFN